MRTGSLIWVTRVYRRVLSTLKVLAALNPCWLWGVVEFVFNVFSLQLYFFEWRDLVISKKNCAACTQYCLCRRISLNLKNYVLCIYDSLIWPKLLQKIPTDTFALFYLGDRSSGFARRSPHHRDGTPLNLCRHHSRHRFKFKTSGEKGHAGTHRKIHAGKNHPRYYEIYDIL